MQLSKVKKRGNEMRKSELTKKIEYWTRQLERIAFLLLVSVVIVSLVYVIIWLLLMLFKMIGI